MVTRAFEARLQALEEAAKPRLISTFLDLMVFAESDSGEEVTLSPELAELAEKAMIEE